MNQSRHRISFNADSLTLEGSLHSLDTTKPVPGVVVCHPHPLYGGAMNNNVVFHVCEQLNQRGIIALRFNFRGVGGSQGAYGEGKGEVQDALAAVTYLDSLPNVDSSRVGIAGYSFGGEVALRVAVADDRVGAVAAISPPAGHSDLSFFLSCAKPKMLISGAIDNIIDVKEFTAFAEQSSEPKVWEVVPNVDHFWMGREGWLSEKVAAFFAEAFGQGI